MEVGSSIKEILGDAIRSKIEKEAQADFKSFSQAIPCITTFQMEKQIQSVYTTTKFREFQEELTSQLYCRAISTREENMVSVYEIRESIVVGEGKRNVIFTVSYNKVKGEVDCSCHLFEFRGTLCRHAIYVLVDNEVDMLPEKYILRRWRKDVMRPHTRIIFKNEGWVATPEQCRYDQMCLEFSEIADLASFDEEESCEVRELVAQHKRKLIERRPHFGINSSSLKIMDGMNSQKKVNDKVDASLCNILDPKVSKRKGRAKGRIKSSLEKVLNKKKRTNSKGTKKK